MRSLRKAVSAALEPALFATLGISLLVCSAGVTTSAAGQGSSLPAAVPSLKADSPSNAYFAIADFDGDRKPDLATVEVQHASAAVNALYSIRFELTAGVAQNFGVAAPPGGLQIVAQDVNGDSFLDLLVSTAWQNQEVAVLLNDGRGNFRLAQAGEFPAAFREPAERWNLAAASFCEMAIVVRPQLPTGETLCGGALADSPKLVAATAVPVFFDSNRLLLFSLLGRAPPSRIFSAEILR